MSINILDSFNYKGRRPDFVRQQFGTIEAMRTFSENYLPDMYLCYCLEDGKVYLYNKDNAVDQTTGRWRQLESGGGGGDMTNYYTKTETNTLLNGKQDVLEYDSVPTFGSTKVMTSNAIATALTGKQDALTVDSTPTSGSSNPVTSGGVYTALSGKQATLTFDSAPTANSDNPVKSNGIKSYVDTAETNAKADWFLRGPMIARDTDFNTLTTQGHYYVNSNDSASTMTNIPVPYGGRLEITTIIGDTAYLRQTYYANTDRTGLICIRRQKTSTSGWSDWVILSTHEECGAIANLGAKNLSRATFTSNDNIYGIAVTANADGTVTANGTATAPAILQSSTFTLKAGTYIFSCSENPQRDSTYDAYVYNVDASTTIARDNPNDSPGTTFTLAQDTTVRINLRVANGYTANNVVFKPMIMDAAIVDATYQPPTPTNAELNDSKITMLNILGAGTRITATSEAPLNFDDAPFTTVGRFNWLSASAAYITNCPSYINGEAKGGSLEVSYVQGPASVLQTVYPSAGADSPSIFWRRFRYGGGTTSNPYRWTNWFAFAGTEVVPPNAQTTNLVGEMRSVAPSLEESDVENPVELQEDEMR